MFFGFGWDWGWDLRVVIGEWRWGGFEGPGHEGDWDHVDVVAHCWFGGLTGQILVKWLGAKNDIFAPKVGIRDVLSKEDSTAAYPIRDTQMTACTRPIHSHADFQRGGCW